MADKKTNYAESLKAKPKSAAPDKSKETITVNIGGVPTPIVRSSMSDADWARVKQRAVKEVHVPVEVSYDEPGKLSDSSAESNRKKIKSSDIEAISRNLATVADQIVSPEEKRLLEGVPPEGRVKFLRERFIKRDFDVVDPPPTVDAGAEKPSQGSPDEWKTMGSEQPKKSPGTQTEDDNYVGSRGGSVQGQVARMLMGATPAQERLAEQEANVAKVNAQGEQHGQEDLAALKAFASKGAAAAEAGKQAQDAASPGRFIADQVDRRVFGDEPIIPEQVKQLPQAIGAGAATDVGSLMQVGGEALGMPNMAQKGADLSAGAVMPPAFGGPPVPPPDAGGAVPMPAGQMPPMGAPMPPPQPDGSLSMSAKMPGGFRVEKVSPEAEKAAAESRLKTKTDIENAQETMAALDIARDGAVRKYAEREALVQSEAAKLSQLAAQAKLDSIEEAKGYQARKRALAEQARAAAATPTDPNRFWNNKSDGQKAAAVIAGALFGFTGQGMQWLQRLDGLVEADNRLQAQDRAAKVQGLQSEAEALGEAGREAIRNGATVAEAHIIDRQTKLEGLKSYLDTMTMKVKNMEAKQRGLQMSADMDKLLADYDQQALQLAQQRADKKTEWNYKNALLGQEVWKATVGKDGTTGVKGPQAMELGGLMAAEQVAKDLKAKFGEKNVISRMFDKGLAMFPGTDAKAYNIARDQAINMIAPLMGAGVLQKHDLDRWEGLMAKAGDVNGEEILNILLNDIRSTYNSKRAALGAAGMDVRQFPVLGGGGTPNINFTPSR